MRRGRGPRHFEDVALASKFRYYRPGVERSATVDAIESDLASHYGRPLFADPVARLSTYRGVARLGALTLAWECATGGASGRPSRLWVSPTRFPRSTRAGGGPTGAGSTKASNRHLRKLLIESAWADQHGSAVGVELRQRQEGVPPEAVACRGGPGPAVRPLPPSGPK